MTDTGYWSEPQISEREKHRAAIHEAGHAVIIRFFGGYANPRIWPNTERTEGEKAWCGQCQIYAEPNQPDNWKRLVGMAGFVSEMMDDGEKESYWIAESLAIYFDDLSQTDVAMIGESWTETDVEEVMRLLSELWNEVELEANCMKAYWE